MVKESEQRYIVSIGKYKNEAGALARKKVALDNGLVCEIIDTQDDALTNVYAGVLLVAEQVHELTKSLSALAEQNAELLKALQTKKESVPLVAVDSNAATNSVPVTKPDKVKVRTLMKEKRKARGFSQAELGAIIGVEFGTISKWETGRVPIPEKHIPALMRILKISREEFDGFQN